MSEPTARPDKPRIVVYESDACQGNITGWDCDDCEDGDCEHECHDTEPTGDLRERLAEALYRWALDAAGASRISPPVHPRTLENLYANSLARADAVLPVFEAALTSHRERAETAAHLLEHWADEHVILRAVDNSEVHADWCYRCRLERAEAAVQRVRRMAQVWIDIRPAHPTATTDAHTLAWAGEQIIAALGQPKETR